MSRWALVTAGAQGLGGAFSEHLIARGYSVVVHHLSSGARAETLVAAAARRGQTVVPVRADLALESGRIELMEAVSSAVGSDGLHVLVHNLGVYPLTHLLETDSATFERVFALTCTAVFHLTQLGLPLLREARPTARVITVGDATCDRIEAHDDATPYHIAKLGVHVLTRTFAERLGPDGITVNMISPGFLENSVGAPPPIPLGRLGRFEDIMGALDYLLSDAAAYVTGTNLRVSGGFSLS